MAYSRYTKAKAIPSSGNSSKPSPITTNFSKGIKTYTPNDNMDLTELRLAQDARFDRIGEYGTRKGFKQLTIPVGKEQLATNESEVFEPIAGDQVQPFLYDAERSDPVYSVKVWLAKSTEEYVVPRVSLYVDQEWVSSSCVDPTELTSEIKGFEVVFMDTPNIFESETLEIRIEAQTGDLKNLQVATVDNVLMCDLETASEGSVTSVFEANIEGVKTILFVHNEFLYRLSEDGTITQIRKLPEGTTKVRFNQADYKIRYVTGKEAPHILDPSNGWSDAEIPTVDLETDVQLEMIPNNITIGLNDNMIYADETVSTRAFWTYPYGYEYQKQAAWSTTLSISPTVGTVTTIPRSTITPVPTNIAIGDLITGQGRGTAEIYAIDSTNVAARTISNIATSISSYDKFSRKFYQNFPAINTGDPITAMADLGGVSYFFTRRNKYQMYSQSADSWSQSQCQAQGGTFSQESFVNDLNYIYFANDNGIYVFDGSSEASLTENTIQNVYDAIPNKEKIVLDMHENRLYVFYPSFADGVNDHCLVYNINLKVWESFDTNTYVSSSCAREAESNRFICGHSRIGMLMLAETDDRYSDIGKPINFNLETSYSPYGSTSRLKRINKWRPDFAAVTEPYSIQCGYSTDFKDEVKYAYSINLKNQHEYIENYIWDNPINYGVPTIPVVHTTIPRVNSEFYRCQIRYQHIAAFEPVIFRSHTITLQIQRIR